MHTRKKTNSQMEKKSIPAREISRKKTKERKKRENGLTRGRGKGTGGEDGTRCFFVDRGSIGRVGGGGGCILPRGPIRRGRKKTKCVGKRRELLFGEEKEKEIQGAGGPGEKKLLPGTGLILILRVLQKRVGSLGSNGKDPNQVD